MICAEFFFGIICIIKKSREIMIIFVLCHCRYDSIKNNNHSMGEILWRMFLE